MKSKRTFLFTIIFSILISLFGIMCIFANVNATDLDEQISKVKTVPEYKITTTVDYMDTVTFGTYMQDTEDENDVKPIEWLVLDRDEKNHRALLFSKYILDNVTFKENIELVSTWRFSDIRQWLNETFYNKAFNDEERKLILEDSHLTNYWSDDKEITDNVFLLSGHEVEKYFRKYDTYDVNKRLATRGTNYAKNVLNGGTKLWIRKGTGEHTYGKTTKEDGTPIFYEHIMERDKDDSLNYEWGVGNSFFWLRSTGLEVNCPDRVNSYGGHVSDSNYLANNRQGGVRPAIWVSYNINATDTNKTNEVDLDSFETIKIGTYKQTKIKKKSKSSKGTQYEEEPIEWIVLDKDTKNKKMLLISKYIIDSKIPYNEEVYIKGGFHNDAPKNVTWEISDIRKWLNETFYEETFTDEEKSKIKETLLINDDNDEYATLGGKDTNDKIFLLSVNEVRKYFEIGNGKWTKEQLVRIKAASGTQYAKSKGIKSIYKNDRDEYEEWTYNNNSYFLRSPGGEQNAVAIVEPDGNIYTGGTLVSATSFGIRPAMWVEYK